MKKLELTAAGTVPDFHRIPFKRNIRNQLNTKVEKVINIESNLFLS